MTEGMRVAISIQARLSDSPYVESITYGRTIADGRPPRPAETNWHLMVRRLEGRSTATIVGPSLQPGSIAYRDGTEVLWIRFKLGVYLSGLPLRQLRDTELQLPSAKPSAFWLDGAIWPYPDYHSIDAFIERLITFRLLNLDPLIHGVLYQETLDLSPRTIRLRFLRAVGLSQKQLQQVERARRAASMLEQGVPILDTAFELGYYDQSHLTRSLKRFIGQTPTELIEMSARELPFFTRLTAAYWHTLNAYPILRKTYRKAGNTMKKILLTGMSGTGKSTVINALAAQGYKAIDADYDEFSEWMPVTDDSGTPGEPVEPERDWVWREERMRALLANNDADILFVSGCSPNMGKFLSAFDHIILLSAPNEIIIERLTTRQNNPYGKNTDEIARVLRLVETVEPLLRRAAGHEIDTSASIDNVVAQVLRVTAT
ncbi:helix-turn-helix domain-containing protein [bacterium]|nr:helix-turn-helix domain-containing protein [bacterium]